ncbi:unnamed protein product [Camellia sinensis]
MEDRQLSRTQKGVKVQVIERTSAIKAGILLETYGFGARRVNDQGTRNLNLILCCHQFSYHIASRPDFKL